MANWTPDQFREYAQRRLKDESRARERMQNANRDSLRLRAAVTQQDHGRALVGLTPRETASGIGVAPRLKITFIVRCLRPRDWDNNCTKFCQDALIKAGILPGDGWDVLSGQVLSLKAKSREDEGTTVIIETI